LTQLSTTTFTTFNVTDSLSRYRSLSLSLSRYRSLSRGLLFLSSVLFSLFSVQLPRDRHVSLVVEPSQRSATWKNRFISSGCTRLATKRLSVLFCYSYRRCFVQLASVRRPPHLFVSSGDLLRSFSSVASNLRIFLSFVRPVASDERFFLGPLAHDCQESCFPAASEHRSTLAGASA